METKTDRDLRVINGAALNATIAELGAQVPKTALFALIATLWASLPDEVAQGVVNHAAAKVDPITSNETFAHYQWRPTSGGDDGNEASS